MSLTGLAVLTLAVTGFAVIDIRSWRDRRRTRTSHLPRDGLIGQIQTKFTRKSVPE